MDSDNTRKDYNLCRRSREIQQEAVVVAQESSASRLIRLGPGKYRLVGNGGSGPMLVSSATKSVQQKPGLCNSSGNSRSGLGAVPADAQLYQSAGVNLKRHYEREDQPSATRKAPCIQFKKSGSRSPAVAGSLVSTLKKHEEMMNLVRHTCDSRKNVPVNHMPTRGNAQKGVTVFETENSRAGSASACRIRQGTSNKKLPYLDKNILIDMARNVIIDKLNEYKAASRHNKEHNPANDRENVASEGPKAEGSKTMEVPDSEFHDFDNDRAEGSFAENQVWAVYDDDDGMPRLYALIRKASGMPFKLQFSWLNSECNTEPESIKWIDCGFHKTCGDFHVEKKKLSLDINSFSHKVVGWTKAANVFQIFPKKGDVWALYRNWAPNWNEHTSEEEKHKYEMVEVLQDYNEEKGVTIIPLVKVPGFKAVFCQHSDTKEVRTVPKEEIFRFSHQVSSYVLTDQEAPNVPKGSKELDPAAMPLELLQVID